MNDSLHLKVGMLHSTSIPRLLFLHSLTFAEIISERIDLSNHQSRSSHHGWFQWQFLDLHTESHHNNIISNGESSNDRSINDPQTIGLVIDDRKSNSESTATVASLLPRLSNLTHLEWVLDGRVLSFCHWSITNGIYD
jgi:hypothetical protein